jgi:tripeptide aminopeptidase
MTLTRSILAIAFVAVAQHALVQEVRAQGASAPDLEAILANPKIAKALDDIKADDERAFAEQKRITEIPAPPFKEKVRAEYYQKRMQEFGLKDPSIDVEGNVIALRKGSGDGRPRLLVSAHLDTVFPEGTDVTVKEKDGAIVAQASATIRAGLRQCCR